MLNIGNKPLALQSLTKHCVALGASGSGKTYACKAIVEEVIASGVSVFGIDIQGDMASLATGHRPISSKVNLLSLASDCADRVALEPVTGCSETSAINVCNRVDLANNECISALTELINDHSVKSLEGIPTDVLDDYSHLASNATLGKLSRAINGLSVGTSAELLQGRPMTRELFRQSNILYMNNIDTGQHAAIIGELCRFIYNWARGNPNDGSLRLLVYVDEIAPFMPPVRNTPAKDALVTLLRKGRKYGIGMLLATQSPGDIDYKALGNIGTWLVGRVTQRRDLEKVGSVLSKDYVKKLPLHKPGQFVMANSDGVQSIQTRLLKTDHKTLSESDIFDLHRGRVKARLHLQLNDLAAKIRKGQKSLLPYWKSLRAQYGIMNNE